MNTSGPQVAQEIQEEKHVALDSAVNRLGSIQTSAHILLDRIRGNESPKKENVETIGTQLTLANVLHFSPQKIHEFCNEMDEILNDLNKELF